MTAKRKFTDGGIPDFVTHYHLADKRPFLNVSDLNEPELAAIMEDLERRRASAGLKRVFGNRYMHLRRLTEGSLYYLFRMAGGRPQRKTPPISYWVRASGTGASPPTLTKLFFLWWTCCGSGSSGDRCPSLADYIRGRRPSTGRPPPARANVAFAFHRVSGIARVRAELEKQLCEP